MCECVCVCMGGQAAWRERRNTRQPPKLNLSGIQPVCGGGGGGEAALFGGCRGKREYPILYWPLS